MDPKFIVHKLNANPLYLPKKQKPRRSAKEHDDAVRQEVKRLKEAEAIKEIFFPEWLMNTMVVKRKNGKWKVCINFTDIKRVCSKDLFPMSKTDLWAPKDELFGCFSWLSLDRFGYQGSGENSIYNP